MDTIICPNKNAEDIVHRLQDYLNEGRTIGGLSIVETEDDQVVLIVDDNPISDRDAKIWWNGYLTALNFVK